MFLTWKSRSAPCSRAGDWVEVRSEEEILRSLSGDGTLEKMPFMPEMLKFCGQKFRISAIAHKTCDPAHRTGGRRLMNAVHLEDLRCDGAAHGGCQAACLLFWKTDWLKSTSDAGSPGNPVAPPGLPRRELELATAKTGSGGRRVYSCQATRLFEATQPLRWWDPRQYILDLTSGNVAFPHMARVLLLSWAAALTRLGFGYRIAAGIYDRLHRLLMKRPAPRLGGPIPIGQPTPSEDLRLQAGEQIRIKSNDTISGTLNKAGKNRGLWFGEEMVPYCGGTYRVVQRVERIINEVTGEMMEMKSPCITLEGVVCRSLYSRARLFCPRAITAYWREGWLERIDPDRGRLP
ncbi:MAG TPA: hypothetical protein VMG60_22590 [Burkholderiaceae bacterium]|nr:hypothetical protein [Burkholderiaceae bacterium]